MGAGIFLGEAAASLANKYLQEFVAAPALAPPTAEVDEALLAKYEEEMKQAASMPLPDEDGDDDNL